MEQVTEIDGLAIHYVEEGTGPTVIFLHGASLGSSARVFEKNLPAIAAGGFRAIAYDQPGFGLSDNPRDHTVSYRRQFITELMDAVGADHAALVGHSQAGGMVVRVALQQPARVSHVVVVGSGSVLPPLPGQSGPGGPGEGQEGTGILPTLDDTRKLLEGNFYNKALITPELMQKRHDMSVGKNFVAFLERSKAREPQKDSVPLWQRLKEVSVPLLLLYGAQDRGSAAERCAILKEREPGLRIELIENAAHLVMWEAAERLNDRLLRFLRA